MTLCPLGQALTFETPTRAQLRLGRVGLEVTGACYLLSVVAIAAIFRLAITPDYQPLLAQNVVATLVVAGLVVAALRLPVGSLPPMTVPAQAPVPWVVGA